MQGTLRPLWHVTRLLAAAGLGFVTVLALAVLATPLPEALETSMSGEAGIRVLDRHGRLIRDTTAEGGVRAAWLPYTEIDEDVRHALLAAEDKRFFVHFGIDPLASLRAAGQLVTQRRVVSGASTLTQQLARTVRPRPRTFFGKLAEAVLALRIELSLSKEEIFEQYVNRIDFGPNVRGIEAASRHYLDKSTRSLSLSEAALVAGMPRGPSLYDPRRAPTRAERRRNRVLARMVKSGLVGEERAERALSEPITLNAPRGEGGGAHFVRALLTGKLEPGLPPSKSVIEVKTTLDAELQREVENIVLQEVQALEPQDVSTAAVLVVENETGEVLAYVGSKAFFDEAGLGQNDGVLALRQPGSALKPFVYAAAMDAGSLTAATLLSDVERTFITQAGEFTPRNYDGRYHGPVRARVALGSSLNLPAVGLVDQLGTRTVLTTLRRFGFESLAADADHYGVALALGSGEVRLVELARAYAALARGGELVELGFARAFRDRSGATRTLERPAGRRVVSRDVARLLVDVLSDDRARASAFGRDSVLALPFEVFVKTGTSKGYRDNVTVGATSKVTVAVWVGNFDGRPMRGTSGVSGAGPIFRQTMLAAMRGHEATAAFPAGALARVSICALSGQRPSPHCSHVVEERFIQGTEPAQTCNMHVEQWVERRTGARSHPSCPDSEARVFERYEARYANWAHRAGRPLVPTRRAAGCAAASDLSDRVQVVFPSDGDRFVWDPGLSASLQRLQVRVATEAASVRFLLNGQPLANSTSPPHTVSLPLSRGSHRLRVETSSQSDEVNFEVK